MFLCHYLSSMSSVHNFLLSYHGCSCRVMMHMLQHRNQLKLHVNRSREALNIENEDIRLFVFFYNKMKFRFTISQSIISQVQQEQKPFNLFLVKYSNKRNRLAKNLQTNPQVKLMQNYLYRSVLKIVIPRNPDRTSK